MMPSSIETSGSPFGPDIFKKYNSVSYCDNESPTVRFRYSDSGSKLVDQGLIELEK